MKSLFALPALLISFAASAAIPVDPVGCPSRDPVNNEVCRSEELMQRAYDLESHFFTAIFNDEKGDYSKAFTAKASWKTKHIMCGMKIMQQTEMVKCINAGFDYYKADLNAITAPSTAKRADLYALADDFLGRRVEAARKKRNDCLKNGVAALDDGVSPARDIATALGKNCHNAGFTLALENAFRIEIAEPMFSRRDQSIESIMQIGRDYSNPDNLIEYVLQYRAAKRQADKPVTKKSKPSV